MDITFPFHRQGLEEPKALKLHPAVLHNPCHLLSLAGTPLPSGVTLTLVTHQAKQARKRAALPLGRKNAAQESATMPRASSQLAARRRVISNGACR
jgi:hypothetical protein